MLRAVSRQHSVCELTTSDAGPRTPGELARDDALLDDPVLHVVRLVRAPTRSRPPARIGRADTDVRAALGSAMQAARREGGRATGVSAVDAATCQTWARGPSLCARCLLAGRHF